MNEKELKISLGSRIKEYRNRLNLTQEKFSELLGISQRQISLIELGKSFPKPLTLSKISEICNCNISDLFNFEPVINIDKLKVEMFKLIDTLPEDKLKTLYIVGKNI